MNRQINLKYVALFGFLAILIVPSVIIIYMRIILTEEVSRDLINTRLNKSLESNEQAISDIFQTAKGVSTVIADAVEANPDDASNSSTKFFFRRRYLAIILNQSTSPSQMAICVL